VDYIAEHLTPGGRAGIIVPEGIIFQSQTAYVQLRKMLVEECLVAVVSLPAGVFNPYSGVKTSILILDKALARQTDCIAFFKIEHDGFNLGAQRRPIDKNDLPQARAEVAEYLRRLRAREPLDDFRPTLGLVVPKEKIAANGDYNLSGERYRDGQVHAGSFPMIPLADICLIRKGSPITRAELVEGSIPVVAGGQQPSGYHNVANREARVITISASGAYAGFVAFWPEPIFASDCSTLEPKDARLLPEYLFWVLKHRQHDIYSMQVGMGQPHVYPKDLAPFKIPLPPLEVQKEIVAEIEGYQKVIDGARAVLDNYRPHIPIHPDWPMVKLGETALFRIESGGTPKSEAAECWGGTIAWATLVDLPASDYVSEIRSTQRTITERGLAESSAKLLPPDSVLVSTRATIGRIGINRIPLATNQGFKNIVIEDGSRAIAEYVALALTNAVPTMKAWATGGTFKELSKSKFCELRIPLPPIETQRAIVAEIEAEQALVNANRELIARMEKKIQATLARVWGEDEPAPAEA
jgi:type I restriction enzyme M protein